MKPEDKEKLLQHQPPGMPSPPTPPGKPTTPPMGRTGKPIHIPLVAVTTSPKDEADRAATESIINQCLREGVYFCPRCDYETQNPETFVWHMADEINKSLAKLNEIYPSND